MGSGISSEKPLRTQADDMDDQIDLQALFNALLKLSCVFEIKESLTKSLIDVVTDYKYTNFDAQFFGVEEWIKKFGDEDLTPQEIYALIKYVELYEPISAQVKQMHDVPFSEVNPMDEYSIEEENKCPLICPYRSDIAEWTATIRSQELKKDAFFKNDNSSHMSARSFHTASVSFNSFNEEDGVRNRKRGDSDMSDLTI